MPFGRLHERVGHRDYGLHAFDHTGALPDWRDVVGTITTAFEAPRKLLEILERS